jgi:hypothetical protein
MKIFNFKSILLVLSLFMCFTSCSSDDDSGSQNPETYINFTIDGTSYNFTDIITAESGVTTLNGNNGEGITNPGDTQIALWFPLNITNGTFDVEDGFSSEYQVSFSSDALSFDFDFAESGSITFTQTSGEYIMGTFSATVTNDDDTTISIENGEFRAYSIE